MILYAGVEQVVRYFNEDVLCWHGRLSSEEEMRLLVPSGVWSLLKLLFKQAPEFCRDAPVCETCFKSMMDVEHDTKNR